MDYFSEVLVNFLANKLLVTWCRSFQETKEAKVQQNRPLDLGLLSRDYVEAMLGKLFELQMEISRRQSSNRKFLLILYINVELTMNLLILWIGASLVAHLAEFLPEECVAELGILYRRMKKTKVPTWKIRLRLLEESLNLLYVFYIQIKIENLWSPRERKIDD